VLAPRTPERQNFDLKYANQVHTAARTVSSASFSQYTRSDLDRVAAMGEPLDPFAALVSFARRSLPLPTGVQAPAVDEAAVLAEHGLSQVHVMAIELAARVFAPYLAKGWTDQYFDGMVHHLNERMLPALQAAAAATPMPPQPPKTSGFDALGRAPAQVPFNQPGFPSALHSHWDAAAMASPAVGGADWARASAAPAAGASSPSPAEAAEVEELRALEGERARAAAETQAIVAATTRAAAAAPRQAFVGFTRDAE